MKNIRVGIIGLGRIAYLLEKDPFRKKPCTHAGTMKSLAKIFRIQAICDTKAERIKDFQRWMQRDIPFHTTDFKRILTNGALDLVVISTNVSSHFEIAKSLIPKVKGILIEKPAASSYKEVLALQRLAQKHKCKVWVNFERRYHPAYQEAHRIVTQKRYGDLRQIYGRVLTNAPPSKRNKVGPLLHDGIHALDLILWYAGVPLNATPMGSGVRSNNDLMQLNYKNFSTILESGGKREYFEFFLQLDFERGRLILSNEGHSLFVKRESKKYKGFHDLQTVPYKYKAENPWLNLYLDIAKGLSKQDHMPISNLSNSVHTLKMILT